MLGYAQFLTIQGIILKIHPNQYLQIEKCPQQRVWNQISTISVALGKLLKDFTKFPQLLRETILEVSSEDSVKSNCAIVTTRNSDIQLWKQRDYRHILKYKMVKYQNNVGESKQYKIEWKEITYRMTLLK